MPLHHRAVLAMETQQLGERGEPDVPSNVVATRPSDDHKVVEPTLSIKEGEHETSLTAALSDQVGSWFTIILQSLARCGSIYCTMVPPEDRVGELMLLFIKWKGGYTIVVYISCAL